jgi:mRNA-degrading endonuclease RelE of RelBE toxin-antitoxin system
VADGDATVRFSPTYLRDHKSLAPDAETQKAIDETIRQILTGLAESPNNPDQTRAGKPFARDRHRTWKRRIAMPGSNMGKRGALRLAYWWRRAEREVVLLFLYYKRDKADLLQTESRRPSSAFCEVLPGSG